MTPVETVMLTRYVKACCPQQAMDEYTADAWHDLLGDLMFSDCKAAAVIIARRQPFVAPAEIRREVRDLREARLRQAEIPLPPVDLADNPAAYQAVLHAGRVAAADGADPAVAVSLAARRARRELEAS